MNVRKKFFGQIMIFTMFLMFLGFSTVSGAIYQSIKIKEYKNDINTLNNQLKITQRQIDELKNIETLKDKENLEEVARLKLNMVKPDEIVYIVAE